MHKFKAGQTVVHVVHGVGVVDRIETREFYNKKSEFYILTIEDNGAPKKVFVPIEVADTRMRATFTREAALEILGLINDGKDTTGINHQTWNRRYREYMEKLHTGNTKDVAEVYIALKALKEDKDLSFGERKLLDQTETRLRQEFATVGIKF